MLAFPAVKSTSLTDFNPVAVLLHMNVQSESGIVTFEKNMVIVSGYKNGTGPDVAAFPYFNDVSAAPDTDPGMVCKHAALMDADRVARSFHDNTGIPAVAPGGSFHTLPRPLQPDRIMSEMNISTAECIASRTDIICKLLPQFLNERQAPACSDQILFYIHVSLSNTSVLQPITSDPYFQFLYFQKRFFLSARLSHC
jgi:hypothetical protein